MSAIRCPCCHGTRIMPYLFKDELWCLTCFVEFRPGEPDDDPSLLQCLKYDAGRLWRGFARRLPSFGWWRFLRWRWWR